MKNIGLWILSIVCLAFAILFGATSILAGVLLLLAAAYTAPFVREKYLAHLKDNVLLQRKATLAIVAICFVGGVALTASNQDAKSSAELAQKYKTDPSAFLSNARKKLAANDYFGAQYELNKLLVVLPDDQALKDLKHEIFVSEMKANIADGKAFLVDDAYAGYKKLMGSSAKTEEVQSAFEEGIARKIRKDLAKEDVFGANRSAEQLSKLFPSSQTHAQLKKEIDATKAAIEKKLAAEAKAKAEAQAKADAEAASSRAAASSVSSAPSSDGRDCRVGGILHATGFACSGTGDVCAMDEKTVVVINGSILPPHANNTTMIKVGYRCSCIRNSGRLHHDKIDCTG